MAQGRAAAAAGGHGWNLSLLQTMQQETREIPFCNQRQELRLVGHKLLHGASSVLERGCCWQKEGTARGLCSAKYYLNSLQIQRRNELAC